MKTSDTAIKKIKEFEGCKLTAYQCSAGVWTIGYGHTKGVKKGDTITQEQADAFLQDDLSVFERYVDSLGLSLTQGQFDALVDFAFNLGTGALGGSTLLKKIRAGAPTAEILNEFKRWNKAGGKVLAGLVKRREWEALRWTE